MLKLIDKDPLHFFVNALGDKIHILFLDTPESTLESCLQAIPLQ